MGRDRLCRCCGSGNGLDEGDCGMPCCQLGQQRPSHGHVSRGVHRGSVGQEGCQELHAHASTGDVLKTNADVTLAAKELGYAPTTPLKEGIQKFIDWYTTYYKDGMDKEMADYVPM